MSERATPETDDNILDHNAPIWLCRKLERERDEARELARELRDALQPALTALVGRMVIKDTDTVERAHAALTKANQMLP